ncbi:hypothetical protein A3D05_02000 [Candidatus Gottesmanbacteria bacterium RIFCSPHIGHO2_02_FULL_40_24]|uniref:acylphosphatase n=1 Tax=Candidatus Gottesmanbacteria bacterium RIFCSPHIGHO2_01_FULL_40_15 TaxID=1798376 RepID=A0A1F5Z3M2_9BACT|nr:MAG: hypothetical protein A2777_04250 [Candidatus Gottesmanbacteria bacterium RIFCSPHIGHO2_01_FULL_40_15]OGG18628.1 MAG: hypothetical protein A3D05_02000 [Candidatus Gottesmanbacteria bacterium RIFCSPHIGHO2_02_FULL_40_24]OGG22826.1 MAG: hypothetical protein A3B48_05565 [Candidatus Gottesmanbacteria bacterium RIFCSPLOWO2_01_FULL_40_10]OGG24939.1 MAG: hypothetical protein A3E42_02805 [Candidatus Gottesmanbacteria bacterium RIFCSPHIGHO2_12_FULL_40_13]OGG31718.1 MAG: hypothetical protein A3I80_0
MMKKVRVHLLISGDVTGVGFRYWTKVIAQSLNLTGYVRNADRGLVEAVFEGNEDNVKQMIEKCRKGPQVSQVNGLQIQWEEANGGNIGFEIRQ